MKAEDLQEVRRVLWAAADEMRANSSLPLLSIVVLFSGLSSWPTPRSDSTR